MTRAPVTASRAQLRLTIAAVGVATLLHIDRLPWWCSLITLAAVAWRLLPTPVMNRLPPAWLRFGATLLLVGIVLGQRGLGGLSAGASLLACMGAAKLMETRGRRDGYILVVVALFLLLAAILERQQLVRLLPYACSAWLACAALASLGGRRESERMGAAMAASGKALLWALPLTAAAFVLFPRVQGGLWGLPGGDQAQTGLGEEMSPGSIAELSVSDAIAFRVNFTGAVPPPQERYWRGPVLHDFDGYTWRRASSPTVPLKIEPVGQAYTYRITMEPHGRNWWYTLDTVDASPSPRALLTTDQQLLAFQPVTKPTSYEASSHLRTRTSAALPAVARRQDTALPPGRNPRTLALAQQLRAQHAATPALVDAVLARFRDEGFQYTLTPPLLDYDSVDDFLFNTRLGFCGHFASAFVALMRAAQVPARVVTGYQGGEWNPLNGYLILRQSDAHAWAEIWIDGSGWQRVDPTAAAAPERLTRSFRDLLPGAGNLAARLLRRNAWLGQALRAWDAANTWWQARVIEFDGRTQLALLSRLGLPDADYKTLAALLLGAGLAWSGVLAWQARRPWRRPRPDAVARTWQRLRHALARAGVAQPPHAAPGSLVRAASARFPELAGTLQGALEHYEQLRFAARPTARSEQLAAAVRRIEYRLRRREHELRMPGLASAERGAVAALVPLYGVMPPALRARTERLAQAFLGRVPLVGCDGLQIDARVRGVIAFQACLLVCTRDLSLLHALRSVLVYPDEFVVAERDEDESGIVTEGERTLSGQSEDDTRILLSWRDVLEGLSANDGYNVVLHEFAHYLDHLSGGELSAAGTDPGRAALASAYDALCAAVDAGDETLIDPYGAEDPAEFFAVCTETFFGLPHELRHEHPDIYSALARFYGLDPASWDESAGDGLAYA